MKIVSKALSFLNSFVSYILAGFVFAGVWIIRTLITDEILNFNLHKLTFKQIKNYFYLFNRFCFAPKMQELDFIGLAIVSPFLSLLSKNFNNNCIGDLFAKYYESFKLNTELELQPSKIYSFVEKYRIFLLFTYGIFAIIFYFLGVAFSLLVLISGLITSIFTFLYLDYLGLFFGFILFWIVKIMSIYFYILAFTIFLTMIYRALTLHKIHDFISFELEPIYQSFLKNKADNPEHLQYAEQSKLAIIETFATYEKNINLLAFNIENKSEKIEDKKEESEN